MTALGDDDLFAGVLGRGRGRPEEMSAAAHHPGTDAAMHAAELRAGEGGALGPRVMSALRAHRADLHDRPLLAKLHADAVSALVRRAGSGWKRAMVPALYALSLNDGFCREIFAVEHTLHIWPAGARARLPVGGREVTFACGRSVELTPPQRATVRTAGDKQAAPRCAACVRNAPHHPEFASNRPELWRPRELTERARVRTGRVLDGQLAFGAPSTAGLVTLAGESFKLAFLDYAADRCAQEQERICAELQCEGPLSAGPDWRELAAWLLGAVALDPSERARRRAARDMLVDRLRDR